MIRFLAHRGRAGDRGIGPHQVGGGIGRAADFAGIPVLVLRPALRAFALDVAVRQEHLLHRIVELLDGTDVDQPRRLQLAVDIFRIEARFVGMGGVVVVEGDVESGEIPGMFAVDARDERFRSDALLLGAQHDRRAVGVVGADVHALVPVHLLESHPDIGLDVFHQMAEMDGAVGVGQGAGDEDFACSA